MNGEAVTHDNGRFTVTVSENITVSVLFEENPNERTQGCGSSIGLGSAVIGVCAMMATVLVLKRKKKD